jgi:hypothetical protein
MERDVLCSCGRVFRAKSPRARSCSSTCRSRDSRAGLSGPNRPTVVTLPTRPAPAPLVPAPPVAAPATPAPVPDDDGPEPELVTTTRRELEDAGKLDTALGQQALLLASRMASPFASAAAVASLAKRHSDLIAALVPPAPGKPDRLDELAERRLRKAAGE